MVKKTFQGGAPGHQILAGVAPDSQNHSDDKEEMSRTLHLVQTKQHSTPAPPQTPSTGSVHLGVWGAQLRGLRVPFWEALAQGLVL